MKHILDHAVELGHAVVISLAMSASLSNLFRVSSANGVGVVLKSGRIGIQGEPINGIGLHHDVLHRFRIVAGIVDVVEAGLCCGFRGSACACR